MRLHSDKLPKGGKNLKPSFKVNVVVKIEGSLNRINETRSTSIKLSKSDSALNFDTEKEDVDDFIFLKERQILAQKSKVRVYKFGKTS